MAEELEEVQLVTVTDENGNEIYYREVTSFDYEGKKFAILEPIPEEEGVKVEDAFLTRVDMEDGEPVYVSPTEEEYAVIAKVFEERKY